MSNFFKKSFQSDFFLTLFLLTSSVLYDVYLFFDVIYSGFFHYFLIVAFYFLFWLLSLRLGRGITVFFLIINFLFFCIFKEYYKFHVLPLNVFLFSDSFKEGYTAGLNNLEVLFDKAFFVFILLMFLQIWFVFKKSFFNLKKALKTVGYISLLSILVFAYLVLIHSSFILKKSVFVFVNQQNIIYKVDWLVKYFNADTFKIVNEQVFLDVKNIRQDMGNDDITLSFLPKHIYLIQVESLTTHALKKMPFLHSIIKQNPQNFYVDKNHHTCYGSANTDFMMLAGTPLQCEKLDGIVYSQYSLNIYKVIKTLPDILKNKGYKTLFFHNYDKNYFSRNNHILNMDFDTVIFEDAFDKDIKRYQWGVDDIELLKKVGKFNKDEQKTFHFIITAGMHTPYEELPEKYKEKNNTLEEAYLNASKVFDIGLKELYLSAPNDSLFIIYGDHNVPELNAFDTPLVFHYKGDKNLIITGEKKEGFKETVYFVNSLFDERI